MAKKLTLYRGLFSIASWLGPPSIYKLWYFRWWALIEVVVGNFMLVAAESYEIVFCLILENCCCFGGQNILKGLEFVFVFWNGGHFRLGGQKSAHLLLINLAWSCRCCQEQIVFGWACGALPLVQLPTLYAPLQRWFQVRIIITHEECWLRVVEIKTKIFNLLICSALRWAVASFAAWAIVALFSVLKVATGEVIFRKFSESRDRFLKFGATAWCYRRWLVPSFKLTTSWFFDVLWGHGIFGLKWVFNLIGNV